MILHRESFSAVLIAAWGRAADADWAQPIAALGGRVIHVAPEQAIDRLGEQVGEPIIVLDLRDGAVSRDLLARLDTLADLRVWPIVAAVDTHQIDEVVAAFVTSHPQLLCVPTPEDWIAAIVAARTAPANSAFETFRESEAARLARLNAEVARIAEVLTRLSKRDEPAEARRARERMLGYAAPVARFDISAAEVRDVIRARRMRDRFFGEGLLEDPAWDMILDLFAAHLERAQVSVSSLCIAAAVAPTTALRWITKLTEAGLLEREPDPFDKRRAFMRLSATALEGMRGYLAALKEAGLALL